MAYSKQLNSYEQAQQEKSAHWAVLIPIVFALMCMALVVLATVR